MCHRDLTVITLKPVDDLLNPSVSRELFLLKAVIHFDQKFLKDYLFMQPLLKGIADQGIQFGIQKTYQSKDAACYSWSYEEDWEVRAVYNPMCAYDPETDKIVDYDARPYSRGWCHSESSEIIIGNMEINKDNRVKDKCLYSIEADDIRFSCYYSTIVKQRKISKGEYEYYQEKIKLNEEMGGLFVPQPSELPSNIRCESSNKQAIGYVGVSLNVAEYRIFISTDDIQYRLPEGYCQGAKGLKEEYTFLDLYLMGYTIAYPDPDPRTGFKGYAWVSGGCTDVRYLGASLEKPSFWPVEINLF